MISYECVYVQLLSGNMLLSTTVFVRFHNRTPLFIFV